MHGRIWKICVVGPIELSGKLNLRATFRLIHRVLKHEKLGDEDKLKADLLGSHSPKYLQRKGTFKSSTHTYFRYVQPFRMGASLNRIALCAYSEFP